jgi:hypothetical protein
MNLIGKLLVMLILVMSIVFMGFAVAVYATHQNWIDVISRPPEKATSGLPLGLKYQLEQAQARNKELAAQFAAIQEEVSKEKAAREQAVAKLEQEKSDLKKENSTLINQEAQLKDDLRKATAAVATAQATLDEKLKQVDSLRTDITTALGDRDTHFNDLVKKQDEFNQATAELTRLQDVAKRLAEQMGKAKLVLDRNDLKLETPIDGVPPKVDGVVLAVGKNGLIEISLGSDDGIQRGNKLEAFRANHYLGRIEVVQTSPDRSVAKVMPEFLKGRIEKEDRVATRFN